MKEEEEISSSRVQSLAAASGVITVDVKLGLIKAAGTEALLWEETIY